jgi:transcriptional regulator with XRE-family HTH domain
LGSSTTPLDKTLIGHRIAAVRAKIGLSQEAFAEALGVSKRAYIHYERGEREPPAGLFKAIYDLYGIDYMWLLSGTDPEPQQAGVEGVDFRLIASIVTELERQLAARGRTLKAEHKARVIRALYQLGREHGQAITPDAVASVVEVAVARGR